MQIIKFNSINSTNSYIENLINKIHLEDFSAVVADYQSNGFGQYGTKWSSERGKNLLISIFKKNIQTDIKNQFYINMRVSLAVFMTLKSLEIPELSIKWPNDILYRNNKISGILIKLVIKNKSIKHAIIGIGINVNQNNFENLPNAISICNIINDTYDLNDLRNILMKKLSFYFNVKDSFELKVAYERALFRKNKSSEFVSQGKRNFLGIIEGVSDSGKLCVKIDGLSEKFDAKSIKMLY